MKETANLLTKATPNRKLIAFNKGCSVQYLERHFDRDYKNWLDRFNEWLDAYSSPETQEGYRIIVTYIALKIRAGWGKIRGLNLPFPNEQYRELFEIRNRLDVILER